MNYWLRLDIPNEIDDDVVMGKKIDFLPMTSW
jgi:hypothetical protein